MAVSVQINNFIYMYKIKTEMQRMCISAIYNQAEEYIVLCFYQVPYSVIVEPNDIAEHLTIKAERFEKLLLKATTVQEDK